MASSVFKSQRKGSLLLVFVFLSIIGCTDDGSSGNDQNRSVYYVCVTCKTQPEALPENDQSFKGIYSGVVNNDIVAFNIDNNNDDVVRLTVMRADQASEFLLMDQWKDGHKYYAVFRGRFSYGHHELPMFNVLFSVEMDGENPTVVFSDEAMFRTPTARNIFKEKSTGMVEVFNGELSRRKNNLGNVDNGKVGVEDDVTMVKVGTQRMVLSRNEGYWYSFGLLNNEEGNGKALFNNGTIVSNKLVDQQGKVVGTLIHDYFSGKATDVGDEVINITAKRVI